LAGGAVLFDLGGGLVGLVPLEAVPLFLGGGFGLPSSFVPLFGWGFVPLPLFGGAGLVPLFGGAGLVELPEGDEGLVSLAAKFLV